MVQIFFLKGRYYQIELNCKIQLHTAYRNALLKNTNKLKVKEWGKKDLPKVQNMEELYNQKK